MSQDSLPFPKESFGQLCARLAEQELHFAPAPAFWAGLAALIERERLKRIAGMPKPVAPAPAPASPPREPVKKVRREALFDALVAVMGLNPTEITKTRKKTLAVVISELLEVSPDLTPEDIDTRAKSYRRKHPTWPFTETALSKHWSELGPAASLTRSAKNDIYVIPTDWQGLVRSHYPSMADQMLENWPTWNEIPVTYRQAMIQKTA
jgi:hypothetical protein